MNQKQQLNIEKGATMEIDFHRPPRRGKKPALYLVLDCETATLPFVKEWELTAEQKQKISIAKPLIYDIAWQIVDRKGYIYARHSFLVQETFFVPNVFNTAYYSWKRPLYMERYEKGEIIAKGWNEIMDILLEDCREVDRVFAYNAMFDFKKAIPFTDSYIYHLYSANYTDWENKQKEKCNAILKGKKPSNPHFDGENFCIRGRQYPLSDLWGIACGVLINEEKYKRMCLKNGLISKSGLYFKTSAEATFQYILKDVSFQEEHTALKDTEIETEILLKAFKKAPKEIKEGIQYFPFQELGTTTEHILKSKYADGRPKYELDIIENLCSLLYDRYSDYDYMSAFATRLANEYFALENFKNIHFENSLNKPRSAKVKLKEIDKQAKRLETYIDKNIDSMSESLKEQKERRLHELETMFCHYADILFKNEEN